MALKHILAAFLTLTPIGIGAPSRAFGDDAKSVCVDAYRSTQELRMGGKLREASTNALLCSSDACAKWAQRDCARWFSELRLAIPSILITLDAPEGATTEGRLTVDGLHVSRDVDRRPIELDPGEHVVRLEPAGAKPVEERILLREAEKERLVRLHMRVDPPPVLIVRTTRETSQPVAERSRPVPWTVYAVGGLGAASLGLFGYFGASGVIARDDLYGCRPQCSQERVDSISAKFVVANVALGVSIVALATATVIYLTRPRPPGSLR